MLTRNRSISIARASHLSERYIVQTCSLTTSFIGLNSRELSSLWRENSAKTPFFSGPDAD